MPKILKVGSRVVGTTKRYKKKRGVIKFTDTMAKRAKYRVEWDDGSCNDVYKNSIDFEVPAGFIEEVDDPIPNINVFEDVPSFEEPIDGNLEVDELTDDNNSEAST